MIDRFVLGFVNPWLSLGRHVHSLINPNGCLGFKPESTRLGDRAMKTGPSKLFIGIDISKDRLDIADDPHSEVWSESNDDAGVSSLIEKLTSLNPCLIVMEATGGLETLLYSSLVSAGLPAVVVNPRQARDFRKALGKLAKTDAIDA